MAIKFYLGKEGYSIVHCRNRKSFTKEYNMQWKEFIGRKVYSVDDSFGNALVVIDDDEKYRPLNDFRKSLFITVRTDSRPLALFIAGDIVKAAYNAEIDVILVYKGVDLDRINDYNRVYTKTNILKDCDHVFIHRPKDVEKYKHAIIIKDGELTESLTKTLGKALEDISEENITTFSVNDSIHLIQNTIKHDTLVLGLLGGANTLPLLSFRNKVGCGKHSVGRYITGIYKCDFDVSDIGSYMRIPIHI